MTDFYKIIEDGFVAGFGTNGNESVTAITEEEYNDLVDYFKTRPTAPSGKAYIMRDNPREWVLVDVPEPGEEEIDDAEAFDIIFGGAE